MAAAERIFPWLIPQLRTVCPPFRPFYCWRPTGKIVLYNPEWVNYGVTGQYRHEGAVRAEAYGAVASLVRSIAPYSLSTPHTGSMDPAGIPGAAITHEDADLIERLVNRGIPVVIKLYMEAHILDDAQSRNIIAEVRGTTKPDEVVVMGGHIDSWDVGAGVLDDAGGVFVAWEAIRLMAKYDIRPQRTVRVVFWTVRATKGAEVAAWPRC